jgi:hypothetical protein
MNTFKTKAEENAYTEAQEGYVRSIAEYCQYAITLQTNLKTYGRARSTIEYHYDELLGSVSYLRQRLNRLLTGNGYRRNESYKPIFLAAIEGTQNHYDRYKTLHVHIALGNTGLPNTEATKRLIEDGVRAIWTCTKVGVDDVRLIEMDKTGRRGWGGYQNKEARKGNTGVIDYSNIQLPMHLRDRLGQQI